jgi:hypothetical protein
MARLKKTRPEIVRKAEELAVEYEAKYKGCCESTFLAVVGALEWGGLEVMTPATLETLLPGLCMLSAGVGATAEGSCGAVTAGALAIGISLGALRGDGAGNVIGDALSVVQGQLLDSCDEKYRSQLCKDIQMKHYGKSWDFRSPEMTAEYFEAADGCVIRETAARVVAAILDELGQPEP